MVTMEDNESCGSRAHETSSSPARNRQQRQKLEVYNEILRRLKDSDLEEPDSPGFDDELWAHFNRLPTRYALDVNVERAEDVLMHKRLLHLAHDPASRPAIEVRLVQVLPASEAHSNDSFHSDHHSNEEATTLTSVNHPSRQSIHPPPAFGSSPNLEALALEASKPPAKDGDNSVHANAQYSRPMHEITFSTDDKPKLLSQLTSLLADIGLNIQEAHAFSTVDGYSLDVFVVDGWPYEETEHLRAALEKEVFKIEACSEIIMDRAAIKSLVKIRFVTVRLNGDEYFRLTSYYGFSREKPPSAPNSGLRVEHFGGDPLCKRVRDVDKHSWPEHCSPKNELPLTAIKLEPDHVSIPSDGTDVWELDPRCLKFETKIASGSFGDLYKGTYCSQEVAIKVLKPERVNSDMQKEFAQEVFILRKVRHKNVVQFIGACTKPPSLYIVTEFMSGGSVYDYLHKQRGVFKLPTLLKVAIDVSKGMNYLHQNNIIHRDLKAANLLMDENEVVKVADFGVARVKAQSGVMTAETGTYRWMSPEVIEHKPYDHKADVFSFGVVLWELLTGKLPYEHLTPLQAAVGVVQKGLRPTIPKDTHPKLVELLERCWEQDPTLRPDFSEITTILQKIAKEVGDDGEDRRREKTGGFLSVLRRGHH